MSMASTAMRMSAEFFPEYDAAGNLDQLDGRLVQLALVVGELVPVAVGALDDDLALLEQALEEEG